MTQKREFVSVATGRESCIKCRHDFEPHEQVHGVIFWEDTVDSDKTYVLWQCADAAICLERTRQEIEDNLRQGTMFEDVLSPASLTWPKNIYPV